MGIITSKRVIGELKKIAARNGGILRPEDVVNTARDKNNVLHKSFEWDNTIAAEQYRLFQARQLIRVTVELVGGTEETGKVFVSLSSDSCKSGGGYRLLTEVLTDEDQRKELLRDAVDDMNVFIKKYYFLKELASVFKPMRVLVKKIK